MQLELNEQDKQKLLACIDTTIKAAQNSIQAALDLVPLATKIHELKEQEADPVATE